MKQTTEMRDHAELELLLPWYVNKTLDADENAAVRQHLQDCDECREATALLRRMQHAVTSESPSPIVPRQNVEGLLDRLAATDAAARHSPSWATPRVLAATAAIVVLGIALLIGNREPAMQDPQLFETATSTSTAAVTGYVIAIQFEAATTEARQNEIITAYEGAYIGPGDQPYTSRVAVSIQAANLEELAGFTREVESNREVVSVRVVAVQLPVE